MEKFMVSIVVNDDPGACQHFSGTTQQISKQWKSPDGNGRCYQSTKTFFKWLSENKQGASSVTLERGSVKYVISKTK